MTDRTPDGKRPKVAGTTKGRSTALEAGANPTYGPNADIGKRFRRPPDNTGNKSQRAANDIDPNVWAWPKRDGELRAQASEFNGKRFVNLRLWVAVADGYRPIHKGVTIPLEAVGDLGDALSAYADANGLRAA